MHEQSNDSIATGASNLAPLLAQPLIDEATGAYKAMFAADLGEAHEELDRRLLRRVGFMLDDAYARGLRDGFIQGVTAASQEPSA